MEDWKTIIIKPSATIKEALNILDKSALQITLVADDENHLIGTITDGDIRRAILNQISLDQTVDKIMCKSFTSATVKDDKAKILGIMRQKKIRHIPILDDCGKVTDLKIMMEMIKPAFQENIVVLMAGGQGKRLKPLTNDCPKPLLEIGGKPILETIIEKFIEYGFMRFYISTNYKAQMLKAYFQDGSKWNIKIEYLCEENELGTAGALGLLPKLPERPFIVMNADLLTNVNFQQLLHYHIDHHGSATMAVREYDFEVPFGVVDVEDNRLKELNEKPIHRFFVNAGIYVLEPETLKLIKKNVFLNMTDLFKQLIERKFSVTTFPIREYWIDIGRIDDFNRANSEYRSFFK